MNINKLAEAIFDKFIKKEDCKKEIMYELNAMLSAVLYREVDRQRMLEKATTQSLPQKNDLKTLTVGDRTINVERTIAKR